MLSILTNVIFQFLIKRAKSNKLEENIAEAFLIKFSITSHVQRNPWRSQWLEVTTLSKTIQKKLTSWRGKSSILIGSSSGVSVSPTRADSNVDPSGEKRRTASKGGRDKKSWNKQVYPISKEVKQVLLNTSRPLDRLQLNIISKTKVRETSWREQEETNLSSFIESPPLTSSEDYL